MTEDFGYRCPMSHLHRHPKSLMRRQCSEGLASHGQAPETLHSYSEQVALRLLL